MTDPDESDQPCQDCGKRPAIFSPCPFEEEVNGNDTPYWMCVNCRLERAGDI